MCPTRARLFAVVAFIHGIDSVSPLLTAGLVSYAGLRLPQSPKRRTDKAYVVSLPSFAWRAIRPVEGKTVSCTGAVCNQKASGLILETDEERAGKDLENIG